MVVLISEDGMNYDLLITEKNCVADIAMLSVLLSVLLSVQKKTCVADIASDRFPLSLPQ